MNKKSKDSIRIEDIDDDDSRMMFNSNESKTNPPTGKAISSPKPLIRHSIKEGKSNLKKKNCKTDVSLSKAERQVSIEESPEVNPKPLVHPLPFGASAIKKQKPKINVVAPLVKENDMSGFQTERPDKDKLLYVDSTERPMMINENHLNFQRRDARIKTKLLTVTQNFQKELGVATDRQTSLANYFSRNKTFQVKEDPNALKKSQHNLNQRRSVAVTSAKTEVEKSTLNTVQKWYLNFNNNKVVSQLTGLIIMISIFGDDLRRISVPPKYDIYVDGFMTFLMFIFVIEMIANASILKAKYMLSFDILFDLLSTMSMLMDVTYFSEDVLATWQKNQNSSSSAAAGQVGGRISNIIKLVRLIRLLRLSKALSKSEAALGEKSKDDVQEELKNVKKQIDDILKAKEKKNGTKQKTSESKYHTRPSRPESRKSSIQSQRTPKLTRQYSLQEIDDELEKAEADKGGEGIRAEEEAEELAKQNKNKAKMPSTFKQDSDLLLDVDLNSLITREILRRQERYEMDINREKLANTTRKDFIEQTTDSYFQKIEFKNKSKAGKKWNESTLKKLIFLVLVMNLGMTISDSSLYLSDRDVWDVDVESIGILVSKGVLNSSNIESYMNNLFKNYNNKDITFVTVEIPPIYSFKNASIDISKFRVSETSLALYEEPGQKYMLLMDSKETKFFESLFQLLSMVFIVSTLIAAYIFSSKDSKIFISDPVRKLATVWNVLLMNPLDIVFNPFYLQKAPERDMFISLENEYRIIGNKLSQLSLWMSYCYGRKMVPLVTNRLIMCHPEDFCEMVGDKYCAYFCLLQISNYLDDLDPEEEDASEYIQLISEIVYRTTDQYNGGTSYLNEGRFFLIWKLKAIDRDANFKQISRDSSETASVIISTNLKILYGLAYTYKLMDIPFKANNLARGSIHCGVLYESIVGSPHYKIDVQYFGLDLNALHVFHDMANKYKTSLLLTHQVFNIIPECMKVKCRKIDIIKFPFYQNPIDIYTIDLRLDEVTVSEEDRCRVMLGGDYQKRLAHAYIKDFIEDKLIKGAKNILFLEDPDLDSLISRNFEFRKNFRNSVDFYILGAWDSAKPFLEKAIALEPEDGPSKFLWDFMSEHNFEKPATWRGFRICSKTVK